MMRLCSSALIFFSFLFAATFVAAPEAQAFYLKGAALFNADDADIDTSDTHWMVGLGSDYWMSDFIALGFELDFTYDTAEVFGTDEKLNIFFIYPYINAKIRIPTPGAQFYTGAGIGYSPILSEFDGEVEQIGGVGIQFLAGVSFGDQNSPGIFAEAQYKITDVEDSGSYQLFALYGGVHF